MKLRNKKTGEIGKPRIEYQEIYVDTENHMTYCYKTLHGMIEEWKDCEDLVGYWYVSEQGIPGRINFSWDSKESIENHKEIGNYFETEEEAEKAVEKLKAWKRLKDKGYRFSKWFTRVEGGIQINTEYPKYDGIHVEDRADLDLLFGGEE